jgi:hypothetical protein
VGAAPLVAAGLAQAGETQELRSQPTGEVASGGRAGTVATALPS